MTNHKNYVFLLFILIASGLSAIHAEVVELRGKITMTSGRFPATAILFSYADESNILTSNIDKEGNFSFKVNVGRAGLVNLRVLRSTYDIMLSAAEKVITVSLTAEDDNVRDMKLEKSPENDAYKAFTKVLSSYDGQLNIYFRNCENEDSCEKALHVILTDYADKLAEVQHKYKGTYTSDVLCKMKMPTVAKNVKNTAEEFRKNYFEKVDFSDSTIFTTLVYRDMVTSYVEYLMEPRLSKEDQFIKYFTAKIKADKLVFHKSAGTLFDALYRNQKEKTLAMFIAWYNTGDNKAAVNNPVVDVKLNNISKVMPGQPYIDVSAPDSLGNLHTLKEVVDKSKCTLLLFWSSECSHCRDEMPFIKEYYKKYHLKGFDVFAVSIEPDPAKWKAFVQEQGLAWTNVITNRIANPNPAMQYVSTSTPTMVLIDNKGVILHRFIPKQRLEVDITDALK